MRGIRVPSGFWAMFIEAGSIHNDNNNTSNVLVNNRIGIPTITYISICV